MSLVVPGQIPSYAKTVNGPWDDWSLTDLAGDPPSGSAGTLSISPANSSEITGTGTASTLGLKLTSYTATDDGTLSTTGSATGGTFGAGTNSSTAVSGSGSGASVGLSFGVDGGTGADGALDLSSACTGTGITGTYPNCVITTTSYASGFNYTSVNIPATPSYVTLTATGTNPLIIKATGNVTIAGTINLNGSNGNNCLGCFVTVAGGAGGAGGYAGGSNGTYTGFPGDGPGGGGGGTEGGGGGHAATGGTSTAIGSGSGGGTYTTEIGGSGGGGGGGDTDSGFGGGGGGGGGYLKIASSGSITNSGIISANGGSGGTGTGTGGGGSGGRLNLIAEINVTNSGTIRANGGTGGGGGGGGRIILQDSDGTITGGTITATGGATGGGTPSPAYTQSALTYNTSGTFTSAAIDLGAKSNFTTLSWTETLNGQTITMKARSSANSDMSGATAWGSCSSIAKDANLSTGGCVTDGHRYVQYQATLSTTNTAVTPTLDSVTIGYNQYLSSSAVSNLRFNSSYTNVIWTSVSWVRSDSNTASSTIKVKAQARTAANFTALASATFVGYNNTNTNSSAYFDRPNANCSYAAGKFGDTAGDNATKETVTCTINTGDTTYLNPTASSNQWLELKLILESDGAQTPVVDAARATYSVNANPEVCYTLTDATTCNTSASLAASQSQSPASYGHIALNSYIRDTDTDTGTTSPGQVLIGLEYSDSSGNFSQSSPPSTASYYTSGSFAQNYTITPNGAGITCSDLDPTGTSTSAFRYLCNINDNHPGNAYQNGVSPNNFASFTIDWNTKQDLTRYSTTQKVRILVNDQEGINPVNVSNPGTSGAFTIDTANPTGSMIFSAIPSGVTGDATSPGIAITASDDTTVAYKVSDNCYTGAAGNWATLYSSWVSPLSNPIGCSFLTSNENADRIHTPYFSLRDAYGNELTSSSVASGQRPRNLALQDTSNILASPASYKNFISWEIAALPVNGFASYNIYRCDTPVSDSTCSQSSSYSLYGTATPTGDRNVNYFTDPNVTSSETYYYRVATKDSSGNISNWSSAVWGIANGTQDGGEGGGGGDATPPTISALSITDLAQTSARVIWTTSESAAAGVLYSTNTSYGSEKSTLSYQTTGYDATSAPTGRAIDITGLSANATYNIQLKSTDASGNITICDATSAASTTTAANKTTAINNPDYCPAGATYSFSSLTQDVTAPVISAITTTEVTHNSAKVSWTTNENSDSCVGYDSASASRTYTSEQCSSTQTQAHSVTLGSLSPTTTYYIKIKSRDSAGNLAQNCSTESKTDCSAETTFSFLTSITPATGGGGGGGKSDFTAPTISNIKISNIAKDSAVITWTTGESASSLVQYGKSENLLSSTGGQIDTEFEHKVTLKGLEADTKYFFKANSIDWAGNIGVSEVKSFTTEKSLTIEEEISKLSTAEVQEKTKEVLRDLEEQIKAQKEDIVDPLQVLLDTLSPLIPEPIIIGESPTIEVAATSAAISWRTDKKSTSFVALSREDQFDSTSQEPYKLVVGNPEDSTKEHKVEIIGLLPATKYHYQVRSKALLGNVSESKDFTFTTKSELPQIVSFLQKKAENDKTAIIYWETSIPTDSVVKYTPYVKGKLSPKDAKLQGKPDMVADHEITLTNLDPGTVYQIEISGKDPFGNATSKTLPDFTTAIDKDAPVISQVRIESAMISGKTPKIQTIISYRTDEPATSQIYFAEGGSDKFKQMTPDLNLSTIHTSVITDFKPASIYRIRIESVDESGNTATSRDFTILTPAQSESIIDIIIKTFENTFGWVKNIRF